MGGVGRKGDGIREEAGVRRVRNRGKKGRGGNRRQGGCGGEKIMTVESAKSRISY